MDDNTVNPDGDRDLDRKGGEQTRTEGGVRRSQNASESLPNGAKDQDLDGH